MQEVARDRDAGAAGSRRWRVAAEVALIFLVFFIHAGWPAPDVNEPHYLGKAKHFWDASWAPRDFFLGTADAHWLFYVTFGWLTLFLPLSAVAWCGRIVTWALLAWAWQRLSAALVDRWLYGVLSAALFVALNDRLHMAGEWVVGGVEAKGFAYVFVLLGLEAIVRDRWSRGLVLLGAASAFHVIVGGWAVLAAGVTWLATKSRPPLLALAPAATGGLLVALAGILPGIALTWRADAQTVNEANCIYVYERLRHHLLPQAMPVEYVVRHLLLVAAIVPLSWLAPASGPVAKLRAFVAAAVGIAALGMLASLLVGWNADLAAAVLRYYWFRTSDVMVPLGVSLFSVAILYPWQTARHPLFAVGLSAALLAAGLHLGETAWRRQADMYPPADRDVASLDDWRAICDWAAEETPPDALFIVPRLSHTFRWRSGRAEVVTRKDLPQDAAGIVEWWRRLTRIYRLDDTQPVWCDSLAQLGAARLQALADEFGADYVITSARPRLALARVGPITRTLVVYDLRSPEAPGSRDVRSLERPISPEAGP